MRGSAEEDIRQLNVGTTAAKPANFGKMSPEVVAATQTGSRACQKDCRTSQSVDSVASHPVGQKDWWIVFVPA